MYTYTLCEGGKIHQLTRTYVWNMARESSIADSSCPAELWKFITPELEALPKLADALAVTPMVPPPAEAAMSELSTLDFCICVLAAASRVEVSTWNAQPTDKSKMHSGGAKNE